MLALLDFFPRLAPAIVPVVSLVPSSTVIILTKVLALSVLREHISSTRHGIQYFV